MEQSQPQPPEQGPTAEANWANLLRKIWAVQAGVAKVPKNGYNDFHKYFYVKEEDLTDALRDLLVKNGLVVTSSVDSESTSEGVTRVMMRFRVIDVDTTHFQEATFPGYGIATNKSGGPDDKGIYKAMTGATKAFNAKFFRVSTGKLTDDPDADTDTKAAKGAKTVTPPLLAKNATLDAIYDICTKGKWTNEQLVALVRQTFQCSVERMTEDQAQKILTVLGKKLDATKLMPGKR